VKSFLHIFSSVKLAIFLLIVITLASVFGTLVPQHRSPEEYQSRYGELSGLLIRLEITQLYQSWWFISFLFLFALNTVVCTVTRLLPKLKQIFNPKVSVDPKQILSYKEHKKLTKHLDLNTVSAQLRQILKKRHYRVRVKAAESTYILARKKALGIFGSDIVHTGILIILLGGILSGLGGFRRDLNITEGEIVKVPQADFQIRLDRFETEFYPTGAVKDWKSTLTVINSGKEQMTKSIEVNHPLSYQGFVFYQSGYGWDWNHILMDILVKKPEDEISEEKIRISIGEKYRLKDGQTEITAHQFVPDFVIAEGNRVATRSLQPNNPAVYLESQINGEVIFKGWIFAKFPDFSRSHTEGEQDIAFAFQDFQAPQYSGIQVAKDPGTNIIWGGCTVLMVGLFAAFYWPSRTLRFSLHSSGSVAEITFGGQSKKSTEEFHKEFQIIIAELRNLK
jgi:cytochrome c biogenesis protein